MSITTEAPPSPPPTYTDRHPECLFKFTCATVIDRAEEANNTKACQELGMPVEKPLVTSIEEAREEYDIVRIDRQRDQRKVCRPCFLRDDLRLLGSIGIDPKGDGLI